MGRRGRVKRGKVKRREGGKEERLEGRKRGGEVR